VPCIADEFSGGFGGDDGQDRSNDQNPNPNWRFLLHYRIITPGYVDW
jgi:hypothetical protein